MKSGKVMNKIFNQKLLEEAKAIAEAEAQAAANAQKQAEQKAVIRKGKKEVEKLSPTPKRIKNTKARKKLLKEAKAIAESEMVMMKRAQAEAESKSTK